MTCAVDYQELIEDRKQTAVRQVNASQETGDEPRVLCHAWHMVKLAP
jgi:hypothetical protein